MSQQAPTPQAQPLYLPRRQTPRPYAVRITTADGTPADHVIWGYSSVGVWQDVYDTLPPGTDPRVRIEVRAMPPRDGGTSSQASSGSSFAPLDIAAIHGPGRTVSAPAPGPMPVISRIPSSAERQGFAAHHRDWLAGNYMAPHERPAGYRPSDGTPGSAPVPFSWRDGAIAILAVMLLAGAVMLWSEVELPYSPSVASTVVQVLP